MPHRRPVLPPPVTTQDILEELDRAVNDHLAWLGQWHRSLLCPGEPSPHDLAYDPHHLCRFGSWYVKHQHQGLVNQPAIRNLARLHREMHDRAAGLAATAGRGQTLARVDYDAFMDQTRTFVAQTRRLEKAFAHASSDLDPLTGLNNRQAMLRDLDRERERALRTGQPCCIGLADLDRFKSVNDTFGHTAGDAVLLFAAECFLAHVRPYDSVYRYGGEEFLFCLPDTDLKAARVVLERVRHELEKRPAPLPSGEDLPVTSSFGVAEVHPSCSLQRTIELADQALYEAKETGRNKVVGWDGAPEPDALAE
ncbi:MAG: diguanylate cyclase [Magnetospirillum sp. WYHS-4]